MHKIKFSSIISFLIILITIISANKWSSFRFIFDENSSILPIYFLTLSLIIYSKKFSHTPIDFKNFKYLFLYIVWVVICIIRGIFAADNRAEYISLINHGFALLLPLTVITFINPYFTQKILSNWFKFIIPIYVIFILFFLQFKDGGILLYPFTIALIGFSVLPNKWKWISVILTLTMFLNLDNRSLIIKYGIALLFGLMYFRKDIFTQKILNIVGKLFLVFPIVMFILGLIGLFNIFDTNKYIKSDYKFETNVKGKVQNVSLIEDSRTFLFMEVISSATENKYVWFGRTPARGNDTQIFSYIADVKYSSGKAERPENEAAILNTFTWTGVVGVILYFFIFVVATNLAINRSNNYYLKLIGLYISFRWLYAWVEDYQRFDIMNITLWIMISMCFSYSFRSMSNRDFRIWILSVFRYKLPNLKHF